MVRKFLQKIFQVRFLYLYQCIMHQRSTGKYLNLIVSPYGTNTFSLDVDHFPIKAVSFHLYSLWW